MNQTEQMRELCPSCRNADIYACTCPFKTARNSQPECFEPAPLVRLTEQKPVAFYYRDGLIRAGYGIEIKEGSPLYAEPKGLVRLTDEEIKAVWEPLHDALCLDYKVFANAIMDAMQARNGGAS